jgi:hypothetical protein
VRDVDWVSLAPDKKVLKAPLNMVMFRLCKRQGSAWLMEQQLPVYWKKKIYVTLKVVVK